MLWGRQNKSASFFMSLQQAFTCRESEIREQSSRKLFHGKKMGGGKNMHMLECKKFSGLICRGYAQWKYTKQVPLIHLGHFVNKCIGRGEAQGKQHHIPSPPCSFQVSGTSQKTFQTKHLLRLLFLWSLYGAHICEYLYPFPPPSPSTAQIQLPGTI